MPGLKPAPKSRSSRACTCASPARRCRSGRACSCWARAPSCANPSSPQELLEKDWGVAADVWSCPSFNELTRDGQDAERFNLLHPLETAKVPFVTQQLQGRKAR
jgi:pyruvate dehydrogenase E1 component